MEFIPHPEYTSVALAQPPGIQISCLSCQHQMLQYYLHKAFQIHHKTLGFCWRFRHNTRLCQLSPLFCQAQPRIKMMQTKTEAIDYPYTANDNMNLLMAVVPLMDLSWNTCHQKFFMIDSWDIDEPFRIFLWVIHDISHQILLFLL